MDRNVENLLKTDYAIRNCSNMDVNQMPLEGVKEFIENFLIHSGYGVGNSNIATMLRKLADKWDD